MKKLDLHGIKHNDSKQLILNFIEKNIDKLPVEIITGNSIEMQKIVKEIIRSFNLKYSYPNFKNLGSLIITEDY
tara:strand:- start:10865 stop:11086 length:222 start_codon:yes stop_codon:yes gene_type:complete